MPYRFEAVTALSLTQGEGVDRQIVMAETLALPKADPATENLPPGALPPPTAAPPPYQALAGTAPPPSRPPSVAHHRPSHPQLIVGNFELR